MAAAEDDGDCLLRGAVVAQEADALLGFLGDEAVGVAALLEQLQEYGLEVRVHLLLEALAHLGEGYHRVLCQARSQRLHQLQNLGHDCWKVLHDGNVLVLVVLDHFPDGVEALELHRPVVLLLDVGCHLLQRSFRFAQRLDLLLAHVCGCLVVWDSGISLFLG